jgi:hypothetical protein
LIKLQKSQASKEDDRLACAQRPAVSPLLAVGEGDAAIDPELPALLCHGTGQGRARVSLMHAHTGSCEDAQNHITLVRDAEHTPSGAMLITNLKNSQLAIL